jgi:diguanylate cyclase (GGDEF)-like protein
MKLTNYVDKLYSFITTTAFDFILVVGVCSILISFSSGSSSSANLLTSGWTDVNENPVDLNNLKGTLDISQYITVKTNSPTIIYRARNCYTDIYINGNLIDEDERVTSKIIGMSPGSRWHVISLPSSDAPVKVTLHVTACFDNSHATIDNIYIGNVYDVYKKVTSSYLIGFILCVFLQLLSIVILIIYTYLKKLFNVGTDLLYLGIASFFTAQWAGCESLICQLYIGHSGFFHIIGYLSLVSIPFSFGLFCASRLKGKFGTFSKYYSLVAAICAIVTTFLHITGIYEFHYTLFVVHILLIILIPALVALVLSYRNEKTTVHYVIVPLLLFVGCILIALFKYMSGNYSNYTVYVKIALISFLFCLIIYQTNEIAVTFSKGLKADMLHDMALNDNMTGLYNRTALNEHMDEYNHIIASYSPLGIIQFDVNNLKRVNDTLGHEMGDKLINAAANGLKQSFKIHCNIYRTGGDEFLVIINDLNPTLIYEAGIRILKEYCNKYNSQPNQDFKLVIAHGFVTIKGNTTLSEAIDKADVLMYQNKRELKAKEKEA